MAAIARIRLAIDLFAEGALEVLFIIGAGAVEAVGCQSAHLPD